MFYCLLCDQQLFERGLKGIMTDELLSLFVCREVGVGLKQVDVLRTGSCEIGLNDCLLLAVRGCGRLEAQSFDQTRQRLQFLHVVLCRS